MNMGFFPSNFLLFNLFSFLILGIMVNIVYDYFEYWYSAQKTRSHHFSATFGFMAAFNVAFGRINISICMVYFPGLPFINQFLQPACDLNMIRRVTSLNCSGSKRIRI